MTLCNLLHMYKVLEAVTALTCTVHDCHLQQPAVSVPLHILIVTYTEVLGLPTFIRYFTSYISEYPTAWLYATRSQKLKREAQTSTDIHTLSNFYAAFTSKSPSAVF